LQFLVSIEDWLDIRSHICFEVYLDANFVQRGYWRWRDAATGCGIAVDEYGLLR
jgi:hypothetical protein